MRVIGVGGEGSGTLVFDDDGVCRQVEGFISNRNGIGEVGIEIGHIAEALNSQRSVRIATDRGNHHLRLQMIRFNSAQFSRNLVEQLFQAGDMGSELAVHKDARVVSTICVKRGKQFHHVLARAICRKIR